MQFIIQSRVTLNVLMRDWSGSVTRILMEWYILCFPFFQYLSMSVHACMFIFTCLPSMETVRNEGSQTIAVWTCQRWNGRIKMTQ